MKKVSQVIVSLVLLMSMLAISCKKNQNAPDPLPDKLVGLDGGVGAIQYDDQNRRIYLLGLTTGYYSTTYKYDSEGRFPIYSFSTDTEGASIIGMIIKLIIPVGYRFLVQEPIMKNITGNPQPRLTLSTAYYIKLKMDLSQRLLI